MAPALQEELQQQGGAREMMLSSIALSIISISRAAAAE
jgi:hypothetical protein